MMIWVLLAAVVALGVGVGVMARRLDSARRRLRDLQAGHRHLERAHLFHLRAMRQREIERELKARGVTPALPVEFRAGQGEDLMLWDLLGGQESGAFIEVGAYDGLSYSVSYLFEAAGWKGVLIEALPDKFELCKKNRPESRCVQAALSRKGSKGTATFTALDDGEIAAAASFLVNSDAHARRMKRQIEQARTVTVPLSTMDDVLADAFPVIDVAVIDVEGGELDLLDGFDLAKRKVRVLLIEELSGGADGRLKQEMERRGYRLVMRFGRNDLYVRGDEPGLVARGEQLASLV